MKVDIGRMLAKEAGFVGVRPSPGPDADIVCDLDTGILLPDNCAGFVMAARVLPYVDDLLSVMSEIYRICAHQAVVCILAPYAHSFVHSSNPLFKQKFDEYTPRYFTDHFYQPEGTGICPEIPDYPPFTPPFDFRLLRMELFYQYPYDTGLYEAEELEVLKTLQANVVHEIMYHFVAVKQELTQQELRALSRKTHQEPTVIKRRRIKEALSYQESESKNTKL